MNSKSATASAAFVIPSLDGLRAISFLLVFAGHGGISLGVPTPAGFGVGVFFFLSGYLITTLLRMEYERHARIDLRLFYLRRVIRIWPPFYLVLFSGIGLTLLGVIHAELYLSSISAQLLHVYNYWTIWHGWKGSVPGTGVYWSLAVEEHFYLLFPALYILLRRLGYTPKQQLAVFLSICGLILAWRCALVFIWHPSIERTFVASDTRMDSILFGCCLAVYGNPALDVAPEKRPKTTELLGLAAALAALLLTFLWRNDEFRETIRYTIQGLALYPLFSAAVRFPQWGPFWLLNLRPVRFVGTLSYSAYLVHHTLIDLVAELPFTLPAPIQGPFTLGLCIAVSYIIWRFVEEPCAVIRRNLSRAKPKPGPDAQEEARVVSSP